MGPKRPLAKLWSDFRLDKAFFSCQGEPLAEYSKHFSDCESLRHHELWISDRFDPVVVGVLCLFNNEAKLCWELFDCLFVALDPLIKVIFSFERDVFSGVAGSQCTFIIEISAHPE